MIWLLANSQHDRFLEEFQSYPEFFTDAMNWGITAGFRGLAFLCGLSLIVYLFRR